MKNDQVYPVFSFALNMQRYSGFYIFKFIIPLFFIVAMSIIVFWIDLRESNTRISVTVTSLLTIIAYRFIASSLLPKIPYLTLLDIFILSATILVFSTIIITSICSLLLQSGKLHTVEKINNVCRIAYPISLVFVSILPFYIY